MQRKLKAKRAELGYTQAYVASKIGMSTVTYIKKENGKRDFLFSEIVALINLFDCKFEDIFLY